MRYVSTVSHLNEGSVVKFTMRFPRKACLTARSLTQAGTETHFGPLAAWVENNGPASNKWTRKTLGWMPGQLGIVTDIKRSDYSR